MPVIPSVPFCEEIPDRFILGETNAEIQLDHADENKNIALSLVEQARYGINIFTQDMDNAILDNDDFENHVFNLAVRHPRTKIRVLVLDSSTAVKKGHCLIRIAQKLTSSVFIKNPPAIHSNDKSAFITVDGIGMLYRRHATPYNYQASANFMSPRRVKKLDIFFNEVWEQSIRDQQVRRLFV